MLKKSQRLTTAQFDQYFANGRRSHSPHLQLIYTPHPTFHGAVVVGKKVSKRAVDRNLYRRRIYNALYRVSKQHTLTGVYIILSKPKSAEASYATLLTEVTELVGATRKTR